MRYNPDKHHRRSIRLKGYDYSKPGWYFVTICVQNREILFGDVIDGKMILNDAGKMVQSIWENIPNYYLGIEIDYYQIMPNHFHGIIHIAGADPRVCPDELTGKNLEGEHGDSPQGIDENRGQPQRVALTLTLPYVVGRFKSLSTKRYIVHQFGYCYVI